MRMDGSSDSVRKKSDSSRGLNRSGVSNRNPISVRASSIRSAGTSEFTLGRNRRDFGLPRSCEDRQVCNQKRECSDVSLRQWLDNPERVVSESECLHIFRQIVEVVSLAHSQGIVVHNVRPSCFVMSSFNQVSFIESASSSDSGPDSYEDVSNNQAIEFEASCSPFSQELHQHKSHLGTEVSPYSIDRSNASQMISGSCLQSGSGNLMHVSAGNVDQIEEKDNFPMKQILRMETNWYTSPEEVNGGPGSCASDIYRLGVILFELYCTFSSAEEKGATMSNLRHRVLPPQLLLKWPKEASFCLWLLHPQPTSRPKMGELLQSEFLNEPRDDLEERKLEIELKEKIEEQELSLEFLLLMHQRKQETADKLREMISFISSDIGEVKKRQAFNESKGGSHWEQNPPDSIEGPSLTENEDSGKSRKRFRPGFEDEEVSYSHNEDYQNPEASIDKREKMKSMSSRLKKNFKKLEAAYFMTRRRAVKPTGKPYTRYSPLSSDGKGSISASERSALNSLPFIEHYGESRRTDGWINSFLEGLCKYLSFTDVKVKAELKQADLFKSSNLVCALGFDRDGEFFATAGVNKKIKVFEYETILNEDRDIHYPVVEMSSRSKVSSICWNGYIKSQIASSNFDGVVQVWDVTRNEVFTEMKEHQKRVWSVDYSVADPTMLASGSDDGSVKLWNINQGASAGTIRTKANVCSVQFPSDSSNFLAFGSADHNIYYYDLRNIKMPLYTLVGHNKTVSYIKFIDSMNLVSASTDNTLKLWDLSMCTSRVLDCPVQSFTGHLNMKNFVGLSISDGYIATGSETNEVFIYHKAFPMPALLYKFNTDSLSGDKVDDTGQFISSVCWRTQSSTLLAANSMGNIKLLEMV